MYDIVSYLGKYNICNELSVLMFDKNLTPNQFKFLNETIVRDINCTLNMMKDFSSEYSQFCRLSNLVQQYKTDYLNN